MGSQGLFLFTPQQIGGCIINFRMSVPILSTKLFIPPPLLKVVLRPRLNERFNEGIQKKLTLISAPAGSGKTTLLSEWVAGCERPVGWLSLDESDHDPARFLIYLISALQTISPNLGAGLLDLLQSPQPPPVESVLPALLNEITAIPGDFILVLDDYHTVDSNPIDNVLAFLIEHTPPGMHLVIATREDPALPIPRLRARGQLVELRATDLRFNPTEAAEFLSHVMDLNLSAEEVTALESRTEGWITGLQLAALSMQGRQDISGFIRAFAGDHRYIVDYLVEEVLRRQPEAVRSFLLQTSILDRLSGPLCHAVTGQEDSSDRLDALERGNFFVIPLDDQRHWYRYHHLFADFLRMHLKVEQPDQVSALHSRASEWYEHNGSAADAIRHALAGEDFVRAARLIELAIPEMRRNRQEAAILGWLQALPEELIRIWPVLCIHYAGALLVNGRLEGVEAWLRDAEVLLEAAVRSGERPDMPPVGLAADEHEFRRLPGAIAVYRAALALSAGDVTGTIKYAHEVIDLAPVDDYLLRGSAEGFLGLAYWTCGDLEAAYRSYAECMVSMQKAGHLSDSIGCAIALGDIRIEQGHLQEALSIFESGLKLTQEHGTTGLVLRGAADMYVGMSEVHRERGDLNSAIQNLRRSKDLGEIAGLPQNPYRWRVAMARIRENQGDLDDALDLLYEAERLYVGDFFPNVYPIAARRARVWISQGRLGQALGWAHDQGLSADDDLNYLHEFDHITLARMLLVQYQLEKTQGGLQVAIGLLERLLMAAENGGRMGSTIEILVLQAIAYHLQGDTPAALKPLERALMLAEPEGYVRIFLDEGSPMAVLLANAAKHEIATPTYIHQLLSSFGMVGDQKTIKQDLIEPLSQRELEVLRLFKTELSGPEIARELVVALSTVRTHTKSIYSKLNVNSRRAAVKRAIELGLI